jgi:hypothetical protein
LVGHPDRQSQIEDASLQGNRYGVSAIEGIELGLFPCCRSDRPARLFHQANARLPNDAPTTVTSKTAEVYQIATNHPASFAHVSA